MGDLQVLHYCAQVYWEEVWSVSWSECCGSVMAFSATCQWHMTAQSDAVRTSIESSSSKLLNDRPPHISTAEQTLPRETRTTLAQLRTGHSRILGQYMNRIDPTARNHCHDCGNSPHDTHHCTSKPTTLTVESLWTASTEAEKHLNLAIDETS